MINVLQTYWCFLDLLYWGGAWYLHITLSHILVMYSFRTARSAKAVPVAVAEDLDENGEKKISKGNLGLIAENKR